MNLQVQKEGNAMKGTRRFWEEPLESGNRPLAVQWKSYYKLTSILGNRELTDIKTLHKPPFYLWLNIFHLKGLTAISSFDHGSCTHPGDKSSPSWIFFKGSLVTSLGALVADLTVPTWCFKFLPAWSKGVGSLTTPGIIYESLPIVPNVCQTVWYGLHGLTCIWSSIWNKCCKNSKMIGANKACILHSLFVEESKVQRLAFLLIFSQSFIPKRSARHPGPIIGHFYQYFNVSETALVS